MDLCRDPKYETGLALAPEGDGVICLDQSGVPGARAKLLDKLYTTTETWEQMDNTIWFNSAAGGKIYEVTMILCHEAVVGRRTVDDATNEIVKQIIALETKFGDMPIREEF